MSSKAGPRAAGTDGSDFEHRERVASQHKQSVQYKAQIRKYILFNILVNVTQAILLVLSHFKLADTAGKFNFGSWQYLVTLSIIPSFLGLSSLGRNRKTMLQVHNFGLVIFGIGGLLYGVYTHVNDVLLVINGEKTEELFGFPRVLIINCFIAVQFVFDMMAITVAMKLLKAWDYKKSR